MNSGVWKLIASGRTRCKSVIDFTHFVTIHDVTNTLDDVSHCLLSCVREIAGVWMCKWSSGKPWLLDRVVGNLLGRNPEEHKRQIFVT